MVLGVVAICLMALALCLGDGDKQIPIKYLSDMREIAISKGKVVSPKPCHYFPIHSREEFFRGSLYNMMPKDSHFEFVHFYNPCMTSYNLGNSLGNYLNELACVEATNSSMIIGRKLWDYPHMPFEYKGRGSNVLEKHPHAFFDGLPDVFNSRYSYLTASLQSQSSSPSHSRDKVIADTKALCPCEKYCWSHPQAPWIAQRHVVRDVMNTALEKHMSSPEIQGSNGTTVTAQDIASVPVGSNLPLIPDAAVHFRCGDTVPSTIYGFLPFDSIIKLIPTDAKTVYVLTDPPARASVLSESHKIRFSHNCRPILQALQEKVVQSFPSATVLVKFGGDPFLDYVRLARARVTVCSASTFCLWPAMASAGLAYFPLTGLVAGWTPETTMPNLGDNFRWIEEPRIVTEFQDNTPLSEALRVLNRKVENVKLSSNPL